MFHQAFINMHQNEASSCLLGCGKMSDLQENGKTRKKLKKECIENMASKVSEDHLMQPLCIEGGGEKENQ